MFVSLCEGGNRTSLFENVKDTLIKSTFLIIITPSLDNFCLLPPNNENNEARAVGAALTPFPGSYLDYFYILKILFFKNRRDRNPMLLFLRDYPAIYKSFHLFAVVTIPFINFISVILCLSCHPSLIQLSLPLVLICLECLYSRLSQSVFG